jgi:prefoldin beta subunit
LKELSPQLQNQIAQFEQLRQQLQVISLQRQQLEVQLREVEGTLEELGKVASETPLYKSIGNLLVRVEDREAVRKELLERQETLGIRVKTLQKQEKSFGERYEELSQKIQAALGPQGG